MSDTLTMELVSKLETQFKNLEKAEPGSKEEQAIVDNIKVLYDILHKDQEIADNLDKQQYEIAIAAKRERGEKIEKGIRYTLEGLAIIVPPLAYARLMKAGLKFEETGTVGNSWTRSLINKVRPDK